MSEASVTRKAAFWVAIVFLLGTAVGVMGGYGYARWSVAAAPPHAPLPEPERRALRVAQLTKDLGLTSDQAKQLDQILLQRHTEVKTVRDQSDAQCEVIRQKGRDQVRAILTPEQKPKFEEFLRNIDVQRKHNAPPSH